MPNDRCGLLCLDLSRAEDVRGGSTRGPRRRQRVAAKALGDPTGLLIALALREGGELCVCDVGWITSRADNLVAPSAENRRSRNVGASCEASDARRS
jgi:ArsR family transcriptional regulator, lead/cadmium/zinc/bismuth-responsive transcriptional repressor